MTNCNPKGYILIAAAWSALFIFTDAAKKSTGAHPSSTLAPGEKACNMSGCHANATIAEGSTVNKLILSGTTDTYEPGKTYELTLNASKATIKRFGFEIVALKDLDNTNVGAFTITQADRTQIITGTGSLSTRNYVTHKLNGTPALSTGFNEWKFKWTAPAKNEGAISFYYVTNCTNNNDQATGDALFNSKVTIKPASSAITENANPHNFNAHYNQSQKSIVITYNFLTEEKVDVTIFDAEGRLLKQSQQAQMLTGNNSLTISAGDIAPGVYFIHLITNGNRYTQQVVIL